MNPASTDSEGRSRLSPLRRRAIALIWVGIVAFGLGFVVGSSQGGDVGSPPAIDLAREVGLALPLDQQPAFADGEITRDEVEIALQRLIACADAENVGGFLAELNEDGDYSFEWSSSDDGGAVQMCQLQQFDATFHIWQRQERTR